MPLYCHLPNISMNSKKKRKIPYPARHHVYFTVLAESLHVQFVYEITTARVTMLLDYICHNKIKNACTQSLPDTSLNSKKKPLIAL